MKKVCLAALAICMASQADATVYLVNLTLNRVAVHGSITTDGTIGTINANNILRYSFSFLNQSITGTADNIDQRSMSLIASATDLSANFKKTTTYQWFVFGSAVGDAAFCVQGSNCYNSVGPALGVYYNQGTRIYSSAKMSGIKSFAQAAPTPPPAVPEPASWAMFIGGFGAMGGMMRRRRSGRPSASRLGQAA